jgi:hypothetical protein
LKVTIPLLQGAWKLPLRFADSCSHFDNGWLGRLDSNQGMAESKSNHFSCSVKGNSENRAESRR